MKPRTYKIEDFILDESFQRYVLHKPTLTSDIEYWENWINEHPEALREIEQAKEALTFISTRKVKPANKDIRDQVYTKLKNQIKKENEVQLKVGRAIKMKHYWYAASFLLIISFTIALFIHNSKQEVPNFATQYLEVIVPEGQRSQLVLPDGTKVWLNSGSTFKYPVDFLKQGRNVYIEGEAFFNVAHNKKVPFIVHMKDKLAIKVLGTEFNVKCYANEKTIETTLIKGSIKLINENDKKLNNKEIELKPNEKATFQKNNQLLKISRVSADNHDKVDMNIDISEKNAYFNDIMAITAWKENELVFNNETFEEIAVKMERWYGFKITINNEMLKKERFTGKFVNNETIYQVLDIFNRSEPIVYTSKNKEISITKK